MNQIAKIILDGGRNYLKNYAKSSSYFYEFSKYLIKKSVCGCIIKL